MFALISSEQNWAGVWHVWNRGAYRVLVRKPEGKRNLEDIGVDGRFRGGSRFCEA